MSTIQFVILVGLLPIQDAAKQRELRTLSGHTASVFDLAFTPDGKKLISGSADGTVKWWNPTTGKEDRSKKGNDVHVYSIAVSPNGKTVAAAGIDEEIVMWDVGSGEKKGILSEHEGCAGIDALAFNPEGDLLLSGCANGRVTIWNTKTGSLHKRIQGDESPFPPPGECALTVAWSKDGSTVVSGSFQGKITLWNSKTGKEVRTIKGCPQLVRTLALSPDGRVLAVGFDGIRVLQLLNVENGEELKLIEDHTKPVKTVAFSPDGSLLVSASLDGTIGIWNTKDWSAKERLRGHAKGVGSVAFSADGKTLASGSVDNTIKLWSIK